MTTLVLQAHLFCESCPGSFTKVKYLTEHQKKCHSVQGKKHTCDQYGYSALYQSVLKKHVSMVHKNNIAQEIENKKNIEQNMELAMEITTNVFVEDMGHE